MRYTYIAIGLAILVGGIFLYRGFKSGAISKEQLVPPQTENLSTSTGSDNGIESPQSKSNSSMEQKITKTNATAAQLAPELVSPDGYLNTNDQPITLAQYRGKDVVLLQFWTYSCINCQRTLPYITRWYSTYKDQGLVVIGVHTPEFAYEHLKENVAKALVDEGITYPVVLDNEYNTWRAYSNRYWPHTYLINVDGEIVYDHIGEGAYDDTEKAIQKALAERNAK